MDMVLGTIAKSGLLIVVGALTNLIFGNALISTVISIILGFVLFRRKNEQTPRGTPHLTNPPNVPPTYAPVVQQRAPLARPPPPPHSRTVTRAPAYCRNCGHKIQSHHRFCGNCGTTLNISPTRTTSTSQVHTTPWQWYPPQEIMKRFTMIHQVYKNGQMSHQDYVQVIKNTRFVDTRGRYWTIGANSLLWYRNEQGTWIPDQPGGALSIRGLTTSTF